MSDYDKSFMDSYILYLDMNDLDGESSGILFELLVNF